MRTHSLRLPHQSSVCISFLIHACHMLLITSRINFLHVVLKSSNSGLRTTTFVKRKDWEEVLLSTKYIGLGRETEEGRKYSD
jgi:hypothetical protein